MAEVEAKVVRTPEEERKRKIKIGALIGLIILLIILILLLFLRPTRILPIRPPKAPPRYLFSVYGDEKTGPLNGPMDVAVDPETKRMYVTDTGNSRIVVFDSRGTPLFTFNKLDGDNVLQTPDYVALDKEGKVYVADRRQGIIFIFSSKGKYLSKFVPDNDPNFVWSPLGLTFDKKGNLYVTDVGFHRILIFDPKGKLKKSWGKGGYTPSMEKKKGTLYFPNDITVDKKGRIFVSDSNNRRVQVFNSKGKFLFIIPTGGLPRGIAFDSGNQFYVVDTFSHQVQIYKLEGKKAKVSVTFGEKGSADGQFSFPNGLTIDEADRIYVTDRENNRVQVWSY